MISAVSPPPPPPGSFAIVVVRTCLHFSLAITWSPPPPPCVILTAQWAMPEGEKGTLGDKNREGTFTIQRARGWWRRRGKKGKEGGGMDRFVLYSTVPCTSDYKNSPVACSTTVHRYIASGGLLLHGDRSTSLLSLLLSSARHHPGFIANLVRRREEGKALYHANEPVRGEGSITTEERGKRWGRMCVCVCVCGVSAAQRRWTRQDKS